MSIGRVWKRFPRFLVFCRFAATTVKAEDAIEDSAKVVEAGELVWEEKKDNGENKSKTEKSTEDEQNIEVSSDPLQYFSWIARTSPCFPVDGNKITVLSEPAEFYQTLKKLTKTANRRIVLASLYLGTGPLEKELVDCIHHASLRCRNVQNSELRVSVLLDYMRGSRGTQNSRTMLLPLLKDFGSSVTVALYHTPALRGIVKKLLPERYNETVGVNHIKAYIFDDTVVISGANLSESYFSNRQDRYIVLADCPAVADFFDRLISCIQNYSFHLQRDDTVTLAEGILCHPFLDRDGGVRYKTEVNECITQILTPEVASDSASALKPPADTVIYPLVQMGPFNVKVDEYVTSQLFRSSSPDVTMYLASGYLNLVQKYRQSIIHQCASAVRILTAAPEANGFFGAKGLSSRIPDAYTFIARKFYDELSRSGQHKRVTLHEFSRPDWTVHVKGLWYYQPRQTLPSMSMVGSPNFGYRSVYRDLEAQIVIVTKNKLLQKQLHEEQLRLYSRSQQVSRQTFLSSQRHIPRWVTVVTPIIRNFF